MRRAFNISMGIVICMVLFVLLGIYYHHEHKQSREVMAATLHVDGTVLPTVREIYPFHLTDNQNKPFSKENLTGHWTLMFFGFTNCGYVCPTTMVALGKMYMTLQKELPPNLMPQVVMVSVDPKRDTVARLNDYVKSFNPAFYGVRGTMAEIRALANQMSVVFAEVKMPNGNYTINHSAEMMLLDPNGNLRAFFSYPHEAAQMVADYLTVIHAYQHTDQLTEYTDSNVTLTDTQGKKIAFSALKGKWVFINHWASWCAPCVTELSQLNQFYQHHKNQVFVFGVSDDEEGMMTLNHHALKPHIMFPQITAESVKALHLKDTYVVPTTYVFNREGKLVSLLLGPQTEMGLKQFIEK